MRYKNSEARFIKHLVPQDDGCIYMDTALNIDGYAKFGWEGGDRGSRYAWFRAHGAIPEGMQVDHICRVRRCVNVEHLRLLTPRNNTLIGDTPAARNLAKTHCPQGHPYSPENTRVYKRHRTCITCSRAKFRRWYYTKSPHANSPAS